MTTFIIQYTMPVENPEKNVSIERFKGVIRFFVPLNIPEAHNLTLNDLLTYAELSGKLALSTTLNKKTGTGKIVIPVEAVNESSSSHSSWCNVTPRSNG